MNKHQTTIMSVLFVSGLVIMMNLYLTIPLTKSISEIFNVSSSQADLLSGLFSLGFALGCLIYGPLSEKIGRRKIILLGIFSLSLITLSIGLSHSFYVVLFLRLFQGIAAASFSPVALAFVGEYFPHPQKTTVIGLISTGFLMAGILGQTLSTALNAKFSFQIVFIFMALLLMICMLLLAMFLPVTEPNNPNTALFKSYTSFKKIITTKSLVYCYMIAFFLLMTFVLMYNLLMNKLMLPPFSLSQIEIRHIRFLGLIGMLFSPLAGKIASQIGVNYLLTYSLCLTLLSSLMMGIIQNLVLLVFLSILFISGIALAIPSLVSLVNLFGSFERGLAVSIYTFVLFLGTSFAPLITQLLLKHLSTNYTFFTLGIIILLPTLCSILILRMKGKKIAS